MYAVLTAALFTTGKTWKRPMSIDRWMGTPSAVHTCNGVGFSPKNEGRSDTSFNTKNLEDAVLHEISQSQRDKYCISHVHEAPRGAKSTETGRRTAGARGWGRRVGSWCSMETELQFCKMKTF